MGDLGTFAPVTRVPVTPFTGSSPARPVSHCLPPLQQQPRSSSPRPRSGVAAAPQQPPQHSPRGGFVGASFDTSQIGTY